MSIYINTETLDFPRFQGDILIEFPDWDVTTPVPGTWAEVIVPEFPASEVPQDVTYGVPYLADGVWTFDWNIRDLTAEEITAIEEARNKRLEDSIIKPETEQSTLNLTK